VEVVHAIVHTATHRDAPWHYSPVTDGGKTRSLTFATQKRLYQETGDASVIEPCHMALGFERNYAWCRAVAILDDDE
jgi:hypothetical protein